MLHPFVWYYVRLPAMHDFQPLAVSSRGKGAPYRISRFTYLYAFARVVVFNYYFFLMFIFVDLKNAHFKAHFQLRVAIWLWVPNRFCSMRKTYDSHWNGRSQGWEKNNRNNMYMQVMQLFTGKIFSMYTTQHITFARFFFLMRKCMVARLEFLNDYTLRKC